MIVRSSNRNQQKKPFWLRRNEWHRYGLRVHGGCILRDARPWYGKYKFMNGNQISKWNNT